MSSQETGQRAAWLWGSYALGECADAMWRIADALGSAVEPVLVTIEPPQNDERWASVELVVREPVDVHHLLHRLPPEVDYVALNPNVNPNRWTAQVGETVLTVRVETQS